MELYKYPFLSEDIQITETQKTGNTDELAAPQHHLTEIASRFDKEAPPNSVPKGKGENKTNDITSRPKHRKTQRQFLQAPSFSTVSKNVMF